MKLTEVINEKTICTALHADNKDEIIIELATLLKEAGRISNLEKFIEDVQKREAVEVTALDNGIAIPHACSDTVKQSSICIGRKAQGVDFGAETGQPVKLIIMFASAESGNSHLALLAKFARMLVYEEFVEELMEAKDSFDILKAIERYENIIDIENNT